MILFNYLEYNVTRWYWIYIWNKSEKSGVPLKNPREVYGKIIGSKGVRK